MKSVILIIILFASLSGIASAATAGQLSYTPLEPFSVWDAKADAYGNFAYYINTVFKLLITLGSLFAVVMLVVAGIGYMVSEAAVDIEKAKQRARAALWGLLLLTGCWLILYTINPNLLNFNLNIPTNAPSPYVSGSSVAPGGTAQNLGDSTKFTNGNPYGFSNLSTAQGYAVNQALGCSVYNIACLGAQQYITYDPSSVNTPDVQKAIANYNSNCSGVSNLFIGNVKTIDGSVVGAPGQTALVCAGPFQ